MGRLAAIQLAGSCLPSIALPSLSPMVVVREARHPRSLDFANERKAMLLRDQGHAWSAVADKVRNVSGLRPSVRLLKSLRTRLQARAQQRIYKYSNDESYAH